MKPQPVEVGFSCQLPSTARAELLQPRDSRSPAIPAPPFQPHRLQEEPQRPEAGDSSTS